MTGVIDSSPILLMIINYNRKKINLKKTITDAAGIVFSTYGTIIWNYTIEHLAALVGEWVSTNIILLTDTMASITTFGVIKYITSSIT